MINKGTIVGVKFYGLTVEKTYVPPVSAISHNMMIWGAHT